jgi:hypothetical protein
MGNTPWSELFHCFLLVLKNVQAKTRRGWRLFINIGARSDFLNEMLAGEGLTACRLSMSDAGLNKCIESMIKPDRPALRRNAVMNERSATVANNVASMQHFAVL